MKKVALCIVSMAMLTGCSLGAEVLTAEQFKTIYDQEIASTKVTDVLKETTILKYTYAVRDIDDAKFNTTVYKLDLTNYNTLLAGENINGVSISVSKATNVYETRETLTAAGVPTRDDILTTGSEITYEIKGGKQQGSGAPILNYTKTEKISQEQTVALSTLEEAEMAKFNITVNPEPTQEESTELLNATFRMLRWEESTEYFIEFGGLYLNIIEEFGKLNVRLENFPSPWIFEAETFYKTIVREDESTIKAYLGINKTKEGDYQVVGFKSNETATYQKATFYVNDLNSKLKTEPTEGSEDKYLIAVTKNNKPYGVTGQIGNYSEVNPLDTQEITADFTKFVEDFLKISDIESAIEATVKSYNTSLELIESTCNSSHRLEILRRASGIAYRVCDNGQDIEDFTISKLSEETGTRSIKQRVTRASLTASDIVTYTYEGF